MTVFEAMLAAIVTFVLFVVLVWNFFRFIDWMMVSRARSRIVDKLIVVVVALAAVAFLTHVYLKAFS